MLLGIVIVSGILGYRFIKRSSISKESVQIEPVAVTLVDVTRDTISETIQYTGTIKGKNQVMILSKTAGTIKQCSITMGKRCRQGDILAVVENDIQEAAFAQAQAQVLAAETNYEKAKKDAKRIEKLFAESASSQVDVENTQLGEKAALAQLKSAQAGYKLAEKQLADTYIRAGISGSIALKRISLGSTVAPGVPIVMIVDDSQFKISLNVNELDIAKMVTGFPVRITIDALPDSVFTGHIDAVGIATEEGAHFYPVDIVIDRTHSKSIKAGMFARSLILTQTKQNALVVPLQAIIRTSDGNAEVFVGEGTIARRVAVKPGIRNQSRSEILSGLSGQERIVLAGKESLQDGSAIVERIAGK